jgi:uncharacterized protein
LLQSEMQRILAVLKEEYKPRKVILFGSLATRKIHEWSDLDLLIVKDTEERPIDRSMEVFRMVQPRVGLDLFVYTPDEYAALLGERFSFLMNVLKEGKVLYEKRDARVAESTFPPERDRRDY